MSEATDVDISPLEFTVDVEQPIDAAFTLFTEKIGTWWPTKTHSIGEDRVAELVFEPRVGGRLFERLDDGTEYAWGEVLVWEPPTRVTITWHPNPEPSAMTEVDVGFAPLDAGNTRVTLTHRHWQRLGTLAAEARTGYSHGWPGVLSCFTGAGR
jgi:uncharacterized protein YndB with AHSA1/START domain